MSELSKRTISLPAEHAAYVDAKVASGDYASASEVVRDGLRALKARDNAVEQWLRGPVVQVFDELEANPARGVPVAKAFEMIRDRVKK
jgi:antitoxin ParD1/3/4